MERLAAIVPAFAALGLESRLGPGEPATLDLQFGASDGHEADALRRSLARIRAQLPAAWEPVDRLCGEWQRPGSELAGAIAELWCELDLAPGGGPMDAASPVPSVFITLRPSDPAVRRATIAGALAALLGEQAGGILSAAVDEIEGRAPFGAWVSHIGVMLGRPVQALRIHVSGVPLPGLERYLASVGWGGDVPRAIVAAGRLLDLADWLVLCLDHVLGALLPRLGLEAGFDQRWGLDPRWVPLLDGLVDADLVARPRRDALLAWPGLVTPGGPQPWPDPLIVAGMSGPEHTIGVVERRLSHVKLTVDPDGSTSAKAYFGAGHVRHDLRATGTTQPELAPSGLRAAQPRPAASLADAIAGGLAFLLSRRNQAGWWTDFIHRAAPLGVPAGMVGYRSDEWVTAYVAVALASLGIPDALQAARDALVLLLTRRPHGGWGYNAMVPADADTTTWVLQLADRLRAGDTPRLDEARAFVISRMGPDGAVATYSPDAAPALARFTGFSGPCEGWCSPHTCVTAAVASLPLGPEPIGYLRDNQAQNGSWSGYWWHDDEYATACAAKALARAGGHGASVARAWRWAEKRVRPDGAVHSVMQDGPSPFATALALTTLAVGGAPATGFRARAVAWLLSAQCADGSWEPSAQLRIPAPHMITLPSDPDATSNYVDDLAVFTTATVVAALAHR